MDCAAVLAESVSWSVAPIQSGLLVDVVIMNSWALTPSESDDPEYNII